MTIRYCVAATSLLCSVVSALALDTSELAALKDTIHEICIAPDRTGDLIKTVGKAEFGVPVLFKIVNGDLSGTLSYEKWRGISITADKYKTDPRECAMRILEILQPALVSSGGNNFNFQTSSGTGSPNFGTSLGQ